MSNDTTTLTKTSAVGALRGDLVQRVIRYVLFAGFIAMVIFFSVAAPRFLTYGNIINIALSSAILLIISVPFALVVITGKVDLSVGSTLGLSGVVTGVLITGGTDWLTAAVLGIVVGALVGAANGAMISVLNLSPIVVTLGMLQVVRGIAERVTTQPPSGFGGGMAFLGRGTLFGIPVLVGIALLVLAAGIVFLHFSASGRHVYGLGVNTEATFLSGINTRRLSFMTFVAVGAAAGLGGVLLAARLDSAPPTTLGDGLELQVLTAVLLGGIAFNGGRGTMFGVVLGVAFLGVLQNGLLLLNVSTSGQKLATGAVLLIAAGLEEFGLKRGRMRALIKRSA
ncbi:ABC transporter permease [Mycolicibacterium vaccae]|jgi:ribose transport system permease protein|uniref:Ribose/xylose/arabinose/galactoside ABC transporters, permease components n=1 Tax=Mycolicibacterium vaccae ATCC 25954 TaxID=1194972 RepID=K0UU76_MYCVA|nr:ABC transporter permease [Mycolicibacterium vaccae]ANI42922.1 ribose/xylose/arabinose/galactoside ABC transporters, permease components [Mycolicibacterium vaccae 95051]EJZ08525.1 ribose/xylose/arabinose/galactoside ABC transporters, permease components [Mycolicibacterium vaccae ATCC 25954]MCV7061017.1 ABC transporter permease [Mycolicibacterium vaccae]